MAVASAYPLKRPIAPQPQETTLYFRSNQTEFRVKRVDDQIWLYFWNMGIPLELFAAKYLVKGLTKAIDLIDNQPPD